MSGHIIVGTAGHVDHGKTLLTAALTGIDTDRLPEEKRRGMTIVPGFVPLDLAGGQRLGLIDVPGHERFVKNMLAGVAGIDMVLLVVAADEGVMPQTVEHLSILHLLGIHKGIVAITKCDMVNFDEEWLSMVREQITQLLEPTTLKGAPIAEVSAATGYKLDELRTLLGEVADGVTEKPSSCLCRLPIDRVFSKRGFGKIITGTLWSGAIEAGQRLELLPPGCELRVRGLQVHGQKVERALAGQRCSLNLAGPDVDAVVPGSWLAASGLLRQTNRLDVSLDLLKSAKELRHHSRLRIHHGTCELLGRVRLLDREKLRPGESCLCQLELESPLAPLRGDRLILRSYSPMSTIAGATVLDIAPPRYRLSNPKTMEIIGRKLGRDCAETLLDVLERGEKPLTLAALAAAAQMPVPEAEPAVRELVEKRRLQILSMEGDSLYLSSALADGWCHALLTILARHHGKYPLRRGIPAAELRQRLFPKFTTKQAAALLESYRDNGDISLFGSQVAAADFRYQPDAQQQQALTQLEAAFQQDKFMPPDWDDVVYDMGLPAQDAAEYLIWLVENKRLTRVGSFLFATSAVREAEAAIRGSYELFTMAQVRDLLGTTRKYVQPLLEMFDAEKITLRVGDARRFL